MAGDNTSNRGLLRTLIFGSGTALYLFFANWAYAAMMAGDVTTSAIAMFLAWALGCLALLLSETQGAFAKWRRTYVNLAGGATLAVISATIFGYFYQHRPVPPSISEPTAYIHFATLDPVRAPDGGYFFPVEIHNAGLGPVSDYLAR